MSVNKPSLRRMKVEDLKLSTADKFMGILSAILFILLFAAGVHFWLNT